MGNIKSGIEIKRLKDGFVFDLDELVIDRWENGMTTIRKEDDSEKIIRASYELIQENERMCCALNKEFKEINPNEKIYEVYKQKLSNRELW